MPSVPEEDLALLVPVADEVRARSGGVTTLEAQFVDVIGRAVDYVIDPVRTARTKVSELDKVEKTFIGLKVEHFVREWLNVPRGKRDLVIAGVDVDVKNTTQSSWMIPKETYEESGICLLSRIDEAGSVCSLGLVVARVDYLGSPNRDSKRPLVQYGRNRILWLLKDTPMASSVWEGLDMQRFRELRRIDGGSKRAALFFEENIGRKVSRRVIEALLFDQRDPMKRLRENGGAQDLLTPKGIRLVDLGSQVWIAERATEAAG